MLKLEIKFNDAQMRAEHKYAPESIYAALDKSFTKYGFRRETLSDGTICYYEMGCLVTMVRLAGSSPP